MNINQQLLDNCIMRDRVSQKALYEACAPYVYTIVKNYISDKSFIKDALQEAFAHIFCSLKNFDPSKGAFKSWIARITVNQCINILKKTGKINVSEGLELIMDIPDHAFSYLEELTKEDIEKILTKMPGGYKTVFLLNIIDGYNHKEIGKMLDITAETSRSQLSRGLQWLRKNYNNQSNSISYEAL